MVNSEKCAANIFSYWMNLDVTKEEGLKTIREIGESLQCRVQKSLIQSSRKELSSQVAVMLEEKLLSYCDAKGLCKRCFSKDIKSKVIDNNYFEMPYGETWCSECGYKEEY